MHLSTTRRAWRRWQASAGPWKGWSICPALLAPDIEQVAVVPASRLPVARSIADRLATTLDQGSTLALLDLDPVLGVSIAALLNEWHVANSVLLLPRWPYAEATLPLDRLVSALVSQARRLVVDDQHLPNVTFVIDDQRTRLLAGRSSRDPRADNRYRLAVADLPSLAALRARGIRRVVKLSKA